MERSELLGALKRTAAALGPDDKMPALSSFFFDGRTVRAYDDEVALMAPCHLKVRGGLAGKSLMAWLSSCGAEDVSVEGNKDVTMVCGQSTMKMSVTVPELFPFERPDVERGIMIPAPLALLDSMRKVVACMGTDEAHPWRMGVTLSVRDGVASVFTTNNVAAAAAECIVDDDVDAFEVVLPPRFVTMLMGMTKGQGATAMTVGDGWVIAELDDGTELCGRTMVETNVDQFVQLIEGARSSVDYDVAIPDTLVEIIDRTTKVLAASNAPYADMSIKSGSLTITGQSGIAALMDSVAVDGDHPNAKARVQPGELLNLIGPAEHMALTEHAVILSGVNYTALVSVETDD